MKGALADAPALAIDDVAGSGEVEHRLNGGLVGDVSLDGVDVRMICGERLERLGPPSRDPC